MKLRVQILTLMLVEFIKFCYADLVSVIGVLTPVTGGIDLSDQSYGISFEINILETYELEPEFYTFIFFPYNDMFGFTDERTITSKVIETRSASYPYSDVIKATDYTDSTLSSVAYYGHPFYFIQDYKLYIEFNGFKIPTPCDSKKMEIYIGFANNEEVFLQVRVLLPFHPHSFVSDYSENNITTRFTSSFGFQKNAFITFQYPDCMFMPESTFFVQCTSLPWLKVEKGIESTYMCELENNTLTISNLNKDYWSSKYPIKFNITLADKHKCKKTDYTYVNVKNQIKNIELERAILFGISKTPLNEINVTNNEEFCRELEFYEDLSASTKICFAWTLVVLILPLII